MLILVDTSVWIDLLGRKPTCRIIESQLERVATCPPIIQEIVQGISDDQIREEIKERFLGLPSIAEKLVTEDYLQAAHLYQLGRKKGYTIRSSVNCLIAALAIKRNIPVWHQDRDYEYIAKYTSLRTLRGRQI